MLGKTVPCCPCCLPADGVPGPVRSTGVSLLNPFSACLILNLGKILIIGGSIANFTNVAATFKVIGCNSSAAGSGDKLDWSQRQVPIGPPAWKGPLSRSPVEEAKDHRVEGVELKRCVSGPATDPR